MSLTFANPCMIGSKATISNLGSLFNSPVFQTWLFARAKSAEFILKNIVNEKLSLPKSIQALTLTFKFRKKTIKIP